MTMRMQVLPDEASASDILSKKKAGQTGRISSTSVTLPSLDDLIEQQERSNIVKEKVIQDSSVGADLPHLDQLYTVDTKPFAEGGQATISTAVDKTLCRTVAVKTLKDKFNDNPGIKAKFIREAQLTSQLDHPAIIPLYSLMSDLGQGLHIGMKLIRGNTLKDRIEQIKQKYESMGIAKFNEQKSMRLRIENFLSICDAISYAHSKGILHCDLKPENIMIGEYGTTCVTDWGIARKVNSSGVAEDFDDPGTISGTPRYISPEAIKGKKMDFRSDIFSLGLILFELVTLEYGTVGTTPKEIMLNTRDGVLNPVQHKFGLYIDPDLAAIITKATENNPERRYKTVEDLSTDLRRWLAGMTVKANPPDLLKKIGRWTATHITLITITALLFGLSVAAVSILFFVYQEKLISAEHIRDRYVSFAAANFFESGSKLDRTALDTESAVATIAGRAAYLYQYGQTDPKAKIFETFPPAGISAYVPHDFRWAPAYKTEISLSDFSCIIPADMERQAALNFIGKLSMLKDTLRKIYFDQDKYNGNENSFRNDGVFISRFYVGFENGIHIAYPGSKTYFKNYDPRKRTWYIESLKSRKIHWTEPYTDSQKLGLLIACTAPVIVKDKLIGVVGADLSITRLDRLLNATGNQKDYVIDKLLIADSGKILMGKSSRKQYNRKDASKNQITELPYIEQDLLRRIKKSGYGIMFIHEGKKENLLLFMKLHALSGYYIEKIDLEKLHGYSLN